MPITPPDREAVKRRAGYRCEYCHIVGWELQIDHVIPLSRRRRSVLETASAAVDALGNLAAACAHCNRLKGDSTTGRDPLSGREVHLYHPRRDAWDQHFAWSTDYLRVLPLSEIGAATISRLRMNDRIIVRQRRLLRQAMAGGAATWP